MKDSEINKSNSFVKEKSTAEEEISRMFDDDDFNDRLDRALYSSPEKTSIFDWFLNLFKFKKRI